MPSTPSPQQPPPPDTGGTSGAGSPLDPALAARLKRNADGLLPAVAQQYDTGEVLMLGWMDDEALHRTLTTGRCTYWSRSRGEYWVKGDTSGHFQHVKSVALDCDGDTLLVRVDQIGAACHTGDRTCFDADPLPVSAPADTDTGDTADTGAGGAGAAGARTTGDTAGAGTGSGAGQPTEDAARHRAEGVDATEERA